MKILGAYHIGAFSGAWELIVKEQAARLSASGLLAETNKILVGVSCAKDGLKVDWINQALEGKAEFVVSPSAVIFEYLTLNFLQSYLKQNAGNFYVWYIHTKGVMSGNRGHRLIMEKAVVDGHKSCRRILGEHDTCGVYWRTAGTHGTDFNHYCGNFWWARSEYLRTLPEVSSLNQFDRAYSEFWIGMGKTGKHFEIRINGREETMDYGEWAVSPVCEPILPVEVLRGSRRGQTAAVIVSGPSSRLLLAEHLRNTDMALVINRAIIKVRELTLKIPVYSMQKDGAYTEKALPRRCPACDYKCQHARPEEPEILLLHALESAWCSPEYRGKVYLFDNAKFGLEWNILSVWPALKILELVGVAHLKMFCFDAYTQGRAGSCYDGKTEAMEMHADVYNLEARLLGEALESCKFSSIRWFTPELTGLREEFKLLALAGG